MLESNASFKCNKKTNFIAAILDGELTENFRIYKNELGYNKLLLKTCNESERLDLQNRVDNLKTLCLKVIELLEEIGHYCKYLRDSI